MVSWICWDPDPEAFSVFHFPILWYGIFFAFGFWIGYIAFVQILIRYFDQKHTRSAASKAKAKKIADDLTVYIVVAAIVGARLGHFFFYEHPSDYLADPLEIFRIRNGGLASHGAIIAIILSCVLFSYRFRSQYPDLTWIRLLDFIAAPAALAGASIRVGNFFNQEILGIFTNVPWAVVFGHPADRTFPFPRHPVQIYEALWYFVVFYFLWRLTYRPSMLLARGKLIGLFLILVFTFRFFIEFLKTEQSHLLSSSTLTMGQILSLPAIGLGFLFYAARGLKG